LNLNLTPRAADDLAAIREYIAEHSPTAADRTVARILQSLAILENFPLIGRPGRIEGTREWSISGLPYVGVYCIADEAEIDIIAIIHTRQQWP